MTVVPDDVQTLTVDENTKRVSYIILGKPGVGKTSLASRLSQTLSCELVSHDKILNEILLDPKSPYYQEVSLKLILANYAALSLIANRVPTAFGLGNIYSLLWEASVMRKHPQGFV